MEANTNFPRMQGKICITTTFDRNYAEGGKTLFQSIRHHTDCAGIDFKVITADPEVIQQFGVEHCHVMTDALLANYSNVQYIKELPVERYRASWHRFEIFNFDGYDRVICIDSDCLCLRDLSYLFSEDLNQYDLISVEDHIVSKVFPKMLPALRANGSIRTLQQRMRQGQIDIQPALLVANKSVINVNWYGRLIYHANTTRFTYSIDEGILNEFIYLNKWRIKLLPLEYDYQDLYEMQCPEIGVPAQPVLVHCEQSKPFKHPRGNIDPRLHKWHDLWWQERNSNPAP